MTRCELFYNRCKEFLATEDYQGLEDFCKKEAKETIFRIKKYIDFCNSYMPEVAIGTVSEGALRPVIEAGDPDIAVEVVKKIKPLLEKKGKKKPKVTSETVKKALAEVKGEPYLTPTERKQMGSNARLDRTEKACDEFLALEQVDRAAFLNDLKRVVDLLGTWGARLGPSCGTKIDEVREQVDALRNEFLLFLPDKNEAGSDERKAVAY